MNFKKILFFSFVLISQSFAKDFCSILPGKEDSKILCINNKSKQSFEEVVPNIYLQSSIDSMKEEGIELISTDKYSIEVVSYFLQNINSFNEMKPGCYEKTTYRSNEFRSGMFKNKAQSSLRKLAKILKAEGVCSKNIENNSQNKKYGVTNNDELLLHFLCLSNVESTLGKDFHGKGGRGMIGINPGTRNAICPGIDMANPNQNVSCALKLFSRNQLADWGFTELQEGKKWGSNRFCKISDKERYNFLEILKEEGCCSQACKNSFENKKSI